MKRSEKILWGTFGVFVVYMMATTKPKTYHDSFAPYVCVVTEEGTYLPISEKRRALFLKYGLAKDPTEKNSPRFRDCQEIINSKNKGA